MDNYELTYRLTRKRITDYMESGWANMVDNAPFLAALDAAYLERAPFPWEIAFIYGNPLAPPEKGLGNIIGKFTKTGKPSRRRNIGYNGG